jgi:hypothetical protein
MIEIFSRAFFLSLDPLAVIDISVSVLHFTPNF